MRETEFWPKNASRKCSGRFSGLMAAALLVMLLLYLTSGCVTRDFRQRPMTRSNAVAKDVREIGRININTASADQLEQLPGIGKALAARIIEHRLKYGPFRRPEHLIIVRGISDKRFRVLRDLITVE